MAALSRISATGLTVAAIATVSAGLTAAAGTPAAHQGYATRVAAPAGGVRCAPAWRAVPVPDPGVSNVLFGVGALTGRDVWAVGSQTKDGTAFTTLVDHFDGTRWRVVPSPNTARDENDLFGFIGAGGSFSHGFSASGTYRIRASESGGTPTSPAAAPATIAVSPDISQAAPARATVRWALSAAAPGFVFDVQVRRPGTARFVNWKTGTRLVTATFTADRGAGTYAFRARVRRVHGAGTTGYSPPVAIHLR